MLGMPGSVSERQLEPGPSAPTQLPANASGKAVDSGPSSWVPATQMAPGGYRHLGSEAVNRDLSVTAFQINTF